MGLEKINLLRKQKGLSIEELSNLSGVPIGTLSKITAGITKNPNLETVKALVAALGCKLDDLTDSLELTNTPSDETNLLHIYRQLTPDGKSDVRNFADYTLTKEQHSITKENLTQPYLQVAESPESVYLAAAHNDAESTEEELELMRKDLDEL
jgi:transcriptional regulator with XRE-family HTH domain